MGLITEIGGKTSHSAIRRGTGDPGNRGHHEIRKEIKPGTTSFLTPTMISHHQPGEATIKESPPPSTCFERFRKN
jgi:phosphoenolpyruvate-protein kinase (PTS system EI component)